MSTTKDNNLVYPDGRLVWQGRSMRCAIGKRGALPAEQKREGDGATPIGRWPLRRLYFRADRVPQPETSLASQPLRPQDGWCDAPTDANYNRFVQHPHPTRAERLWREDNIYDLIVPLGYNDDPVVPGRGSAIFLHVARPDFAPTEGCVALARQDLLFVLRTVEQETHMMIGYGIEGG